MKTNKLKNLLVDVILHSIFYKYMSIKMIFTNQAKRMARKMIVSCPPRSNTKILENKIMETIKGFHLK